MCMFLLGLMYIKIIIRTIKLLKIIQMPRTLIDYFWEATELLSIPWNRFFLLKFVSLEISYIFVLLKDISSLALTVSFFVFPVLSEDAPSSSCINDSAKNWTATTTTSFHLSSFFWDFLIVTGITDFILWQFGTVSTLLFRRSLSLLTS